MMQLLRVFSSSRNQLSKGAALSLDSFTQSTSFSTARQNFSAKGRIGDQVYAPFSIYKGKAALSLSPVLPTFTKLESGSVVVERRGSVMLKFMPAIGERKYDSEKKQLFALSATEVGSLISLGPKDSCELFHDPSMQSSNAGQVRKSLSIKPHADGYFISLTVVNNLLKTRESFSVPVTTAEFAVMKTACSFALPHIMGWDRLTNKVPRGIEVHKSEMAEPQLLDEWER
ncbi:single-stranded DNA-binding protein WHY2, mitochondrial [Rosa rugosa]|uniref:single-stranded DNA-binding protein WHY2, mitochondrial n=1 Tax=Rosa rugosa TaxID=74645 RepID=UPI002B40E83C|nr:single-stranded DNA-binding protein WHY2, mitochondrial [Rosa rugosa]